jgi:DNA end-binding protein Ku
VPSTVWSGAISFGLVSVPVKLVSAVRSRDISFHQLEEGTGARIRYRKVSEASGEEVPTKKIVKGYEIAPGRHVVIEPEELKAIQPPATRAIELEAFVDLADIDPVYFEQPYYLLPEESGTKPYRLLVDTMERLGKVGIGKVVMRSKESLVAIRPRDGFLCMETMRYADEVVGADEVGGVPGEDVELQDRERAMAAQLVEALSTEFDPALYRNDYRDQLLELVERKAAGEEIVAAPMADAPAVVVDLMAALEASLRDAGGAAAPAAAPKSARRAATAVPDAPDAGAETSKAPRRARSKRTA